MMNMRWMLLSGGGRLVLALFLKLAGMLLVRAADVSRAREFELVSRVSCGDGLLGKVDEFLTYRHLETGMHVLLTRMSTPYCEMSIAVPTYCEDNRGLSNALAHIITKKLKNCKKHGGVMQQRQVSVEASSLTTELSPEDTIYRMHDVKPSRICDVLELSLDHVLHQHIEASEVHSEVFSFNISETEKCIYLCGKVFDSIRDESADDRLDYEVNSAIVSKNYINIMNQYRNSPAIRNYEAVEKKLGAHYWKHTGVTGDIMTISQEDLLHYHSTHYKPENVIVHVSGPINRDLIEELLATVAAALKPAAEYAARAENAANRTLVKTDRSRTMTPDIKFKEVMFAASEEKNGNVYLVWNSGEAYSLELRETYEVLFHALREDRSCLHWRSHLKNTFLSDCCMFYGGISMVNMIYKVGIYNVPVTQDNLGRNECNSEKVLALWRKAVAAVLEIESSKLMDAISKSLRARELELKLQVDMDSHRTAFDHSAKFWMNARLTETTESPFGTHFVDLRDHLNMLRSKGAEFWREKLRFFLDTEPLRVSAVPSMNKKNMLYQEQDLAFREMCAKRLNPEARLMKPLVEEPYEPLLPRTDYCLLPMKLEMRRGHRVFTVKGARSCALNILIPIERLLPPHLWPLLPLYHHMLEWSSVDFSSEPELHKKLGFAADETDGSRVVSGGRIKVALRYIVTSFDYDLKLKLIRVELPEDTPLSLMDCVRLFRHVLLTHVRFERDAVRENLAYIKSESNASITYESNRFLGLAFALKAGRKNLEDTRCESNASIAYHFNQLLALQQQPESLTEDLKKECLFDLLTNSDLWPIIPASEDANGISEETVSKVLLQLEEIRTLLASSQAIQDTTFMFGGRSEVLDREMMDFPTGTDDSILGGYYPHHGPFHFAKTEAVLHISNAKSTSLMLLTPIRLQAIFGEQTHSVAHEYWSVRVLMCALEIQLRNRCLTLGLETDDDGGLDYNIDEKVISFTVNHSNQFERLTLFHELLEDVNREMISESDRLFVNDMTIAKAKLMVIRNYIIGEAKNFSDAILDTVRNWRLGMTMNAQEMCDVLDSVTEMDLRSVWRHFYPFLTRKETLLLIECPADKLSDFKTRLEEKFPEYWSAGVKSMEMLREEVSNLALTALNFSGPSDSERSV